MRLVARPRSGPSVFRAVLKTSFLILKNGEKLSSAIVPRVRVTAAKNCHAVAIGTVAGNSERQLSGTDVDSQSASLSWCRAPRDYASETGGDRCADEPAT